MSQLKVIGRRALERAFSALNRADEIGGEVRDFIQERVLVDERYITARRRAAALFGKSYVSKVDRDTAQASKRAAAAKAAPPPAASIKKADKQGLGNPEIAAQIYGKNSCPWTGRAITLLESLKVDYDYVDLDDSDNAHYSGRLIPETKQNTVPYVYVRGQFIGGFNALSELHRAGQLEYWLMSPEEREKANPALKKVAITARPNTDELAPGDE